jgi:hypothetical protein
LFLFFAILFFLPLLAIFGGLLEPLRLAMTLCFLYFFGRAFSLALAFQTSDPLFFYHSSTFKYIPAACRFPTVEFLLIKKNI